MIPIREIKEKARQFLDISPSTIERDYAQNWLLAYLNPIKMAFKGGTGIKESIYRKLSLFRRSRFYPV